MNTRPRTAPWASLAPIAFGTLICAGCDGETPPVDNGGFGVAKAAPVERVGYRIESAARFGQDNQPSAPFLGPFGDGGVRVAGQFYGPAPFGDTVVETPANALDLFVAAFDETSSLAEVKRYGSLGVEVIAAMPSGPAGEFALVGSATGSPDFGAGSETKFESGFFAALYAPDGKLRKVVSASGEGFIEITDAAYTGAGELWLIGSAAFKGQLAGGAVHIEFTHPTYGSMPAPFVAKLDPNGELLVYGVYPPGSIYWGNTFAAGAATHDGGIVVGGSYTDAIDFGGGVTLPLPNKADQYEADGFILRLGADGSAKWARPMGGDRDDDVLAVAAASDGRVAAGGYLTGFALLGGKGTGKPASEDGRPPQEPFFVVFDENGAYVSHTRLEVEVTQKKAYRQFGSIQALGFADDGVVAAGVFEGKLKVDDLVLEAASESDVFVAHVTRDGAVARAGRFAGSGREAEPKLLVSPDASMWIAFAAAGELALDDATSTSGKGTGYYQTVVARVAATGPLGLPPF